MSVDASRMARIEIRAFLAIIVFAIIVFAALMLTAGAANAHRHDFPFTYDWQQASAGERELESHSLYDQTGKVFVQQLEFEYGVSDRFMVAPYVTYAKDEDSGFQYRGYQIESRYQLGKFRTNTVLPGLYFEVEKPRDENMELEGKIILSVYDDRGGDFSVNLITERQQEAGARSRYAMSAGYALPVGKHNERGGFEVIKDIDTGRVNLGPTFSFSPSASTSITGGIAAPVNNRSDNKTQFRLVAEYEW